MVRHRQWGRATNSQPKMITIRGHSGGGDAFGRPPEAPSAGRSLVRVNSQVPLGSRTPSGQSAMSPPEPREALRGAVFPTCVVISAGKFTSRHAFLIRPSLKKLPALIDSDRRLATDFTPRSFVPTGV